jgi:hypothetical protein
MLDCQRCGQTPATNYKLSCQVAATLCRDCINAYPIALRDSPIWQAVLQYDATEAFVRDMATAGTAASLEQQLTLRKSYDTMERAVSAFTIEFIKPLK